MLRKLKYDEVAILFAPGAGSLSPVNGSTDHKTLTSCNS